MASLPYHIIERTPKVGKFKDRKVYSAQSFTYGMVSFDDLCKELADGSTVDKADIKAVLSRMATVVPRLLERGFSVDAGELGIFRATFGSKSVESVEAFNPTLINTPKVTFYPRTAFRDALRGVGFERVSGSKYPKRVKLDTKPRDTAETPESGTGGRGSGGSEGVPL